MSMSRASIVLIGAFSGVGLTLSVLGGLAVHERSQAEDKAVAVVQNKYGAQLQRDTLTTDQKKSDIFTINVVKGYIDFKGDTVKKCTIYISSDLVTCEGGIPKVNNAS